MANFIGGFCSLGQAISYYLVPETIAQYNQNDNRFTLCNFDA